VILPDRILHLRTFGCAYGNYAQFQKLGHQAILIIGDFTTLIGDPSREEILHVRHLVPEEIEENAKVILSNKPIKYLINERTKIVYNSEWLGKMSFADVIKLCFQVYRGENARKR
jgi:tyrosyl-tRNA synthetase